jgi:hypothetical protein
VAHREIIDKGARKVGIRLADQRDVVARVPDYRIAVGTVLALSVVIIFRG